MVEQLVANQLVGVRFSIPAQNGDSKTAFKVGENIVDTVDKGQRTFRTVHEIMSR